MLSTHDIVLVMFLSCFSARDFYHDLDSSEAKKWLYFDKFKMVLHYHAVSMCILTRGVKYLLEYNLAFSFVLLAKTKYS